MSFLLSFCARGFFVATVFPLSLIIIQPQENKIWLCIAIVFVVSVLGSIAKESALWKKSKTEYENKGVINLKEGRFSILQWLSVWNQEKSKKGYWGTLIGSFLGVLVYQLSLKYFIPVSQVVVIIAFLFLTSLLSWKLGRGLFWAIKIRQMEKTLHFRFKTEFDQGFIEG